MNPPLPRLLHGFQPRPPSPRLRARLFPPTPPPARAPSWLASFSAAGALALTVAAVWNPTSTYPTETRLFPEPYPAAPIAHLQHNRPPQPKIHSTNTNPSTATFAALLLRQTNAPSY
jgi:hypothetical protein